MPPQSGGWEKLLCKLLWVWVCDLGWHVAGVRNKPFVCSAKIGGGVCANIPILMTITSQFPTGHPAEKQGATLWPEGKSLQDRMLHDCRNQHFLFIKGKLATISAPIPAALILCFKVTPTCFLAPNCRRHCRHSFLTRHF